MRMSVFIAFAAALLTAARPSPALLLFFTRAHTPFLSISLRAYVDKDVWNWIRSASWCERERARAREREKNEVRER